MRQLLFTCIFIYCSLSVYSQCFKENFAFKTGEKLSYDVYYNWEFIWLQAGYVDFSVKEKYYLGHEVYHFDALGATHKSYDWIFKVRDHYQSYLDKEMLYPLWFRRINYEGGFEVDNQYQFDQEEKVVYSFTQNTDQLLHKDTLKLPECTYDLMSIIYNTRNLQFEGLKVGDSIPIRTLIDNEFYDLYIRYLGNETIIDKFEKEHSCIKFSALLVSGTIFKGGEDLFIWVSADENRVPVLVEAKILVGSIKVYLRKAEGLRN